MLSNIGRDWRPRARNLALAAATIVIAVIGAANLTPAKAWYDAYGYWHPNHHSYYWRERHWTAYERHRWWCEHHPYECGYGPRYDYYFQR